MAKNPRAVKLPTKFTMMPVRVNSKGEVQIKVSPTRKSGRVPKNIKSIEQNPGKEKRRIRAARKAERRAAGFPERYGRERGALSLRTRRALESGKRRGRKQKAPAHNPKWTGGYHIVFAGWTNPKRVSLSGYNAWDYLGGDPHDVFATKTQGLKWIRQHHKGPDADRVNAKFKVVKM